MSDAGKTAAGSSSGVGANGAPKGGGVDVDAILRSVDPAFAPELGGGESAPDPDAGDSQPQSDSSKAKKGDRDGEKEEGEEGEGQLLEGSDSEEGEEGETSEPSSSTDTQAGGEVKVVKARTSDGKVLEIPETVEFIQKIDGKKVPVTLRELKENYAGKVSYDRKFGELNGERQAFQRQVKVVDEKLNEIFELTKTSPIKAHIQLARMGKVGVKEALTKYLTEAHAELKRWTEMTPEAQEAEIQRMNAEFERDQLKSENAALEQSTRGAKVQAYVFEQSKRHGVSSDEFEAAAKVLNDLAAKGEISHQGLTDNQVVDRVVAYALLDRRYKTIEDGISKVSVALRKDNDFFDDVKDVVEAVYVKRGRPFTTDDVAAIVRELTGHKSATRKSDSAGEAKKPKPAGPEKEKAADSGGKLEKIIEDVFSSSF